MKIAILDDYQDAVRKLECFQLLTGHDVKVFTNTVQGIGQLASRLAEADALVLIRERTRVTRSCSRSSRICADQPDRQGSNHIDMAACTERGIAVPRASARRSRRPS